MKKVLSAILAIIMVFSLTTIAFATDTSTGKIEPVEPNRSITIANANLRNFYYVSTTATLTLSQSCSYVSVCVHCSSGTDNVVLVIEDISTGTFTNSLPVTANGSTYTFHRTFPAGGYNIYFLGSNVLHTIGMVAFST